MCEQVWEDIENHLHQNRFADSGRAVNRIVVDIFGTVFGLAFPSPLSLKLHLAPSAFNAQTLTSTRWLLDAVPDGVDSPLWYSILTVDQKKQQLFMARLLFIHDRACKRGGRGASNRLSLPEWNNELERCCLMFYILDQMEMAADHAGNVMFDEKTMEKASKRAIEGHLGC